MMNDQQPFSSKVKPSVKPGRFLLFCIGLFLLAVPVLVFSALNRETQPQESPPISGSDHPIDHQAVKLFDAYNRTSTAYMEGSSSARTLNEYYSRRQYPGSPPLIPHKITVKAEKDCLACHAKGGWAKEFARYTPVTPHPEKAACRQCHVRPITEKLFVEHDWQTVAPPLLGRSYLPGGPPPIPHALQMRENCIACHVGPGAVTPIRVEHPMRGNCRQCHVPETVRGIFNRPKPEKRG